MQTRWPWAVAATSVAPLCLRAAALRSEAGSLAAVDAQGFASDLGMALLAAAVLVAVGSRAVALLVALLWTAAHYANYELVRVLGAPATLREAHYLFDTTFAAGSALAISSPWLLACVAIVTIALAVLAARGGRGAAPGLFGAGAALAIAVALLPDPSDQPAWRQADFLQRDLALAAGWALADPTELDFPDPPAAMLDRWPALAADLAGEPRIAPDRRARNVLLVVLESVSGIHLASFAGEHGRTADAAMPNLDALAERSLRYVSFVAHQRKTNRGLYALLCGELPNLSGSTPKMSAAAKTPWRVCLPDVLREVGMHTAYLQAAPLAFMLKDRFLPRAGFDDVDGQDWFERSYTRSAWGVDDRAFFEQAGQRIEELRAGGEPWFLTLLNVGTHHPYSVPDDFQPERRRSFRRAAAYLDQAFGSFVERLEQSGALDDTLLVVTSDESAGFAGFDTEPTFKLLSQNWGMLLVRGPGVPSGIVREPYGLADLPLSMADYLGQEELAGHFFGRSVFRRYDAPRHLFFANSNVGSLGAIEPAGTLLVCPGSGECRRHPTVGGRFFGIQPDPDPAPAEDEGVALLRDLAKRSAPVGARRPRSYELLVEPEVRLEGDRPRMLHGGQFVHLERGEWLEVEYALEVSGEGAVEVDWLHALTGHRNATLLRRRAKLAHGGRLELRYRYVPEDEVGQLQCRTIVRLLSGERAVLRHAEARMRIRSAADRPPSGVQVERFEVVGS